MRSHPMPSVRLASIAIAAAALVLSACTATGSPPAGRARADGPVEAGLTGELEEQDELTEQRLEALEAATAAGTVGLVERVRRDPAPGWAGERLVNDTGNDWEPAIAADPNAPFVYILHNRYGGQDACANGCPDPAMILHVSRDGGRTWGPERFLCRCRGVNGQYDPLIEVVPQTGDVVAVWMNRFEIQFSRSTDHGRTWSDPVFIHPDVRWGDKPNMALGADGQDVYVLVQRTDGGRRVRGHVARRRRHVVDDAGHDQRPVLLRLRGGGAPQRTRRVRARSSFTYTGRREVEGALQVHLFASDDERGDVDRALGRRAQGRQRMHVPNVPRRLLRQRSRARRGRGRRPGHRLQRGEPRPSDPRPCTRARRGTADSPGATACSCRRTASTPRSPRPSARATTALASGSWTQRNARWNVWYRTYDRPRAPRGTRASRSRTRPPAPTTSTPTGFDRGLRGLR